MTATLGITEDLPGMIAPPGMTTEGLIMMTENRPVKKDCSA